MKSDSMTRHIVRINGEAFDALVRTQGRIAAETGVKKPYSKIIKEALS